MLSQEALIRDLDLRFLEERLTDLKGWREEDAKTAVRRYRNFLILLSRYPGETLAPAPDMDEAWHNHILYTVEYMRDCHAIFGEYLHHTPMRPSQLRDKEVMEEAQLRTALLYQKEFGEPYLLELDVSTFWGT